MSQSHPDKKAAGFVGPPRAVIASVGLGLAFGVGIVLGGMGSARGAAAEGAGDQGLLEHADHKATTLRKVQEDLKLSFHEELAKPAAAHVVQKNPVDTVAKPKPAPAPVEVAELPPPADDVVLAAKEAKPDAAKDPAKPEPAKPEAKPSEDDQDEENAPLQPDPARLQAAMAKVLGNQAPGGKPAAKTYALQIASFPTQRAADEMAKKLRGEGHRVSVVAGEIPQKGPVFRVRIGGFPDREKADAYKANLDVAALVVTE